MVKMHVQVCHNFSLSCQSARTQDIEVGQAQQCLSVACCKCCCAVLHTGTLKGPKPCPETPMGSSKGFAIAFSTFRPPKSPTATTSFIGTSRPLVPENTTTLPLRQVAGTKGKDLHSTSPHIRTNSSFAIRRQGTIES